MKDQTAFTSMGAVQVLMALSFTGSILMELGEMRRPRYSTLVELKEHLKSFRASCSSWRCWRT